MPPKHIIPRVAEISNAKRRFDEIEAENVHILIQPSQITNVKACLEGKDFYTAKEPESILDFLEKYVSDNQQSLQAQIDAQQSVICEQRSRLDEQQTLIDEQRSRLDEQQTLIDEQRSRLDEQRTLIDEQRSRLDEQQTLISELQDSNKKINGKVDRVLGLLLEREESNSRLVLELGQLLKESKK